MWKSGHAGQVIRYSGRRGRGRDVKRARKHSARVRGRRPRPRGCEGLAQLSGPYGEVEETREEALAFLVPLKQRSRASCRVLPTHITLTDYASAAQQPSTSSEWMSLPDTSTTGRFSTLDCEPHGLAAGTRGEPSVNPHSFGWANADTVS
jgi:hypothetical protein